MTVPFNRPVLDGNELPYIKDAIERGQLAGDGHYTEQCEQVILKITQAHSAHLTHSCTAALEMAAILVNLKPGDEVIMPSYTFVSTANAVVLRGATPVFVDIEPETLNLDPELVEAAITDKTRCVFVVHYAGVVCDMTSIQKICAQYKLPIVEDAAQALGSTRNGIPAGRFGDLAAFSFHETKNIISGEGGCLVTNAQEYQLRAEIIREKGTNRRAFFRGAVDKYSWVDLGSSYLPGELVSAFLFAQLESIDKINNDRLHAWNMYHERFVQLENNGRLRRPIIPEECVHNGHMYYLLLEEAAQRDSFIAHMKRNGITCPFHYVPLHSSTFGQSISRLGSEMTYTDDLSARLVRMPLFRGVSEKIDQIFEIADRYFD